MIEAGWLRLQTTAEQSFKKEIPTSILEIENSSENSEDKNREIRKC